MATDSQVIHQLAKLPADKHPFHNPMHMARIARQDPKLHRQLQRIQANPTMAAAASSGGSGAVSTSAVAGAIPTAADPTGTNVAGQAGNLGWGQMIGGRLPNVRHVLLGFAALALGAGASGQATATPNVAFKGNAFVGMPSVLFGGTVSQFQSGIRPQYVTLASEDLDMYQPLSYGRELDLDPVKAAVAINATVTNGAAGTATFYGALIGVAVGVKYREQTSKLMNGSLGSSGAVSAGGTGSLTLTPLIGYTPRKVLFTPGSGFSDYFIVTSITAGIQNQLMGVSPIPASVFNDLFPLFVDFDRISPAVPLTVNYQNVSASAGTLKGSTRGDVNAADLAKYGPLDVAA